ncbi:MAG: hypothetical protein IPK26_19300 [Planctomycetes bacterium]|nr:hypothetical protein [Planctomycetota bacterium]
MARTARGCALLGVAFLAGCTGVSPRPEDLAAVLPPARQVTGDERAAVERNVGEALHALELRRFEVAGEFAAAALRIDPACARGYAVRGMVRRHQASAMVPADPYTLHRADGDTQLAMRLAPADATVMRLRAQFLAASGHLSAAAAALEAWLLAHPDAPLDDSAPLYALAGEWRYELGEERAALPHLRNVVGQREDATTWFRIGMCELRVAMAVVDPAAAANARSVAESAAKAFARCAELAPGDRDAHYAVATALAHAAERAGEQRRTEDRAALWHKAAQRLRDASSRFADDPEPLFRLGVVLEAVRDREAAIAAYEQALQRHGEHLGSLINLATALTAGPTVDAAVQQRARSLRERALAIDARRGGLGKQERQRLAEAVGATAGQ